MTRFAKLLTDRRLIMMVSFVALLVLMVVRQPFYPGAWFDEGLNVNTAMMLARYGLYALPDASGPRLLDPAIQSGPTVVLAIAAVFRIFGVGWVQARLAMVGFAVLALLAYLLKAEQLIGNRASILAVLLLLTGNQEEFTEFVFIGRQALGEVPALGFYLLGLLIWWRTISRDNPSKPGLVLSGLAWGAAMVTKSQMLLLLPASLGILMMLDRVYYRQTTWRACLVPLAVAMGCVVAWYVAQIIMIGPDQFRQNSAVLREGFELHVAGLNFNHWRNAAAVVWNSGFLIWGAPGLIWGGWKACQRGRAGFMQASALTFPTVALLWFVFLSIGWARYAFYTFVSAPIWLAGLLADVWHGNLQPVKAQSARRFLVAGLTTVYIIGGGWSLMRDLVTSTDRGYFAMRDYLLTQVPADVVIESWEWEMSLEALQPIHHPSTSVTNAFTAKIWSHTPLPANLYTVPESAEYLLIGPFGAWTGIYKEALARDAEPVVRFNEYALYRLSK